MKWKYTVVKVKFEGSQMDNKTLQILKVGSILPRGSVYLSRVTLYQRQVKPPRDSVPHTWRCLVRCSAPAVR